MIADSAVIAVLLLCIFWGSKRGIAKMVLNIAGFGISAAAGLLLYKPVSSFLETMEISKGLAEKLRETGAIENMPGIMLDSAMSYVADDIYAGAANTAVSVISFLAVLIIVRLVLFLISMIMGVASSLPVIHQINGLAGGIAGFCMGAIIILVALAVVGIMEAFGTGSIAEQLFNGSNIALLIYNNNPILGIFAGN